MTVNKNGINLNYDRLCFTDVIAWGHRTRGHLSTMKIAMYSIELLLKIAKSYIIDISFERVAAARYRIRECVFV